MMYKNYSDFSITPCLAILPDKESTWVWVPLHTSQLHYELNLYRGKQCIYGNEFAFISEPDLAILDSLWRQCPSRGTICEVLYFVTAIFEGKEVFLGYTPSEGCAQEMITNLDNLNQGRSRKTLQLMLDESTKGTYPPVILTDIKAVYQIGEMMSLKFYSEAALKKAIIQTGWIKDNSNNRLLVHHESDRFIIYPNTEQEIEYYNSSLLSE